ncbi:unnamed protein product [Arabis nemorensis]|uniref:GTD-binding domain-containing protein n=1 Tax=Arabis nemorensis TaxID=586526 RepID=A0A565CRN5_9BRAS|nr:unnamed protein product [Arabis nemorensis]
MVERTMSLGVGGNNGETSGVRETMWAQQELLQKINQELDAEREASSSAASEALSMILRLQGEKAALEMEASQYKRMAEEKMTHAETSLALFEDLIYQKEMEIASLEFQVQAYRCKLLSLGCSDPAVVENRFPENLIFFGETSSRVNQKRKMKRNLSSPFDVMTSERSPILSDISGESFEDRKGIETSLSPREDLNAYWEQIRRIDDHVREISDTREAPKETKFPLLRRESLSHALVSQVSNTILESAKSDVSSIMEMMKNPDRFSVKDASLETLTPSPNVQDIFEVPKTKEGLTIISEEEEPEDRNVRGKMVTSNYERKASKPPRDTSIKGEHLSLLKEIREQLNVMQSEMRRLRSELHQSKPVSRPHEDRALNSIQEAMIHFWL